MRTLEQLEAENERPTKELQRLRLEMLGYHAASSLYPVVDPENRNLNHVIRGTPRGIAALCIYLDQRFEDGRTLGRAEAEDAKTAA